jgi:hypothetical protein
MNDDQTKPASDPAGTPTNEPAGTPANDPVGMPTSKPVEMSTNKPMRMPTHKPVGMKPFDWKPYALGAWMVFMTAFLFYLNGRIGDLQQASQQIISTQSAVESVVLSSDKVIIDMDERIKGINGNVNYIVQKVRRR